MACENERFAKNLKLLRNEKGMTQEELAKKAGVSSCTIVSYERMSRMPTLQSASRIANALGVSIGDMVGNMAVVAIA